MGPGRLYVHVMNNIQQGGGGLWAQLSPTNLREEEGLWAQLPTLNLREEEASGHSTPP